MEVRNVSQGGQTALDNTYRIVSGQDSSDNVVVSQGNDSNSIQNTDTDSSGAAEVKTNQANEKDVKKAVDKLNGFLEGESTHVEYSVHDVYKHDVIIKIVDNDTGKVIMEIPPKKILDMVAKMCELIGVLIDRKV